MSSALGLLKIKWYGNCGEVYTLGRIFFRELFPNIVGETQQEWLSDGRSLKKEDKMVAINLGRAGACCFSSLPNDAIITIFGFLPSQALHTASLVCLVWNRLVNDENFLLVEWNKNKCEAGNENLRKALTQAMKEAYDAPIGDRMAVALKKTPNPFSDRKRIVDYIFENRGDVILHSAAWGSAAEHGHLPLLAALFPLIKDSLYLKQYIAQVIQKNHVDFVKKMLPELNEERAKEKICISVQYSTKEGESLSLRGCIGDSVYDLNSWEKGFPMKKVRGRNDLWEIILIPVIRSQTCECDPFKDDIRFPFKPVLHLANGEVRMSKDEYHVKPRTDISIAPEF
jgi:hypothetical protein